MGETNASREYGNGCVGTEDILDGSHLQDVYDGISPVGRRVEFVEHLFFV
jgi:predicted ester cyclase